MAVYVWEICFVRLLYCNHTFFHVFIGSVGLLSQAKCDGLDLERREDVLHDVSDPHGAL